jgi:hypothetical protein
LAIYVKHNKDFDADSAPESEPEGSGETRVLSARLVEVERSREDFPFSYLPELTQRLLREAFACYTADLNLAFAILCRQTIAVTVATERGGDAGEMAFKRLYDDAAGLSGINHVLRAQLRAMLFAADEVPEIDADQAAVLIELVKDMFRQRYVRTAKLRRAIKVRRYFAHEARQPVRQP